MESKNLNRGSISDLDDEAKIVTKNLHDFFMVLKEYYGIKLHKPRLQAILREVNKHYKKHRDTYKNICYVTSGDAFKIISWTAMFLYQENKNEQILHAACAYMNELLKELERAIPDKTIIEIVAMLCNDGKDDNVAVGKNGLYMAFKCASEAGL
ncbi:MAG: hypothetical protein K2N54_01210 [Helicobacter sp.]|nr:hypothetical protein [Helicobacter sp.]MDE7254778.1 hypothetical protein [Helicobacter sp.]